ncbi:MAG: Gfo/Idh/MocA family oxidoreductase [Fimbriimonadaceae bacterium]|nr:Gfo/Idh/MocA family oxidoreductase [Fimbriimonadaceae bacterium]
MYRAAFLGCGPRARSHAEAYQHVTGGTLAALCDLNAERLNDFGNTYQVAARYHDFATMVAAEKPDLVHVVTLPKLRVELLTQAVELGVPAVIVEKPLATDLDDLAAIAALDGRGTKIVVNHQLRFHRRFIELLEDVAVGRIGELRFIDGSCASRTSEQGSHLMNLIWSLNGNSPATLVQAGCGGTLGLIGDGPYGHPGPDNAWALLEFANGVRGSFICGCGAPRNGDPNVWFQKRVTAYGDAGHVSWSMVGWSKQLAGQERLSGPVDYRAEDVIGQAGLTDAVFAWLADEAAVHPTCLAVSAAESRSILATYASTVAQAPVALPLANDEPLLPPLRAALGV